MRERKKEREIQSCTCIYEYKCNQNIVQLYIEAHTLNIQLSCSVVINLVSHYSLVHSEDVLGQSLWKLIVLSGIEFKYSTEREINTEVTQRIHLGSFSKPLEARVVKFLPFLAELVDLLKCDFFCSGYPDSRTNHTIS